jgi:hypothetical protein
VVNPAWAAADWQAHLGRKVSIRFHVRDDPAYPFSEAIGVVQSVAENADGDVILTLIDRRGITRSVPIDDIIAAKLFPVD